MRRPSPEARAQLDEIIKALTRMADGWTIDDFRASAILDASMTQRKVKRFVVVGSLSFFVLAVCDLGWHVLSPPHENFKWLVVSLWAFSLGGLGAIANTFLHLLKMVPKQTLNTSDYFDVVGRTILGCLFSTVLSLTLLPDIVLFFANLKPWAATCATETSKAAGAVALGPFLLGYSLPLVLRILDKAILAIEITIGADDRRTSTAASRMSRSTGKRR